ncbi:MAG: hypothetical protein ABSA44_08090 [Bacteroidota bacterium]
MKIYIFTISILCTSLIMLGCNKTDNTQAIKVGMTYEEVESLLGKPISIDRGANELKLDVDKLSLLEISYFNPKINPSDNSDNQEHEIRQTKIDILNNDLSIMRGESKVNSMFWAAPHSVQTVGNLIYVAWVYERSRIDTHYIVYENRIVHAQTDTIVGLHYYVDGKEVSKNSYENISGFINIPKNIKNESRPRTRSWTEIDSNAKKYYLVVRKYTVLFDASSGRVVSSGYSPMFVISRD